MYVPENTDSASIPFQHDAIIIDQVQLIRCLSRRVRLSTYYDDGVRVTSPRCMALTFIVCVWHISGIASPGSYPGSDVINFDLSYRCLRTFWILVLDLHWRPQEGSYTVVRLRCFDIITTELGPVTCRLYVCHFHKNALGHGNVTACTVSFAVNYLNNPVLHVMVYDFWFV